MKDAVNAPTPDLFFEAATAYVRTEALRTAVELGVFTAVAAGAHTAAELAQRCRASDKGMRVLCDYLVVVGFLRKDGTRYMLSADTAMFLDRNSPAYMGGVLEFLHTPTLRQGYANLTAAVRKGGTVVSADGLLATENPDWVHFARAMVPMMIVPAQRSAQLVDRPASAKLKVLDIAAGHGLFGIEVAKRFVHAEVTGLDWPNVLEVARENAQRAGLSQRYHTLAGDAFEIELGEGYDVVLIPNFLHHFSLERCVAFLQRVHRSLRSDGIAITVEFVPDENRVSPPLPATFAMVMLVATAEGDAYTWQQLDAMFKRAGFQRSSLHALAPSAEHAIVSYAGELTPKK
jgi:2-polyprenyl-3-methyl-5-hydroxy-6-metoxy-1,4-benzoquinol methylase